MTIFYSCEKDPEPLTQEEAITELENVSGEYSDIRGEFENLPSSQVQSTLDELDLPIYDLPNK